MRQAAWLVALGLELGLAAHASPSAAGATEACPQLRRVGSVPAEAVPEPRTEPNWQDGMAALSRLPAATFGTARLVFLGDSLVQSWAPPIFDNFYGARQALNLGVSGDFTQALLWRLDRLPAGNRLNPALFVLLIGTNNSGVGSNAEDTAFGIAEVVRRLRRISPGSRELVVGLLPRGATVADPLRTVNRQVNALVASCADDRTVFFADPGEMLTDGEGRLNAEISYDQLHLTWLGYGILSAGLEPTLRRALQAPAP